MDIIVKYIDELLEKSTPEAPMWNIEKIRQGLKSNWNYIDGVMIKAVLQMYDVTKDEKYLKFADNFIDYRVHEDGTIDGYNIGEKNIDNVNAGKTLFELYDLTGKEKYRKAIDLVYSQIEIMPRCNNEARSFWHKVIYPNQVWLVVCIWDSHFTLNMRLSLIIERIIQIYLHSSSMLLRI